MNKLNVALATVLISTVGFATAPAMAEGGEGGWKKGHKGHHGKMHHRGKRGKHMMKRMARKLGLTDEQKAEMKTLREAHREEMKPLREQRKAIRTSLEALDPAAADYDAQITVIADQQANLARQMFILKNKMKQQMSAVLTDEQRAKMKEMRAERKQRKEQRRARWNEKQDG